MPKNTVMPEKYYSITNNSYYVILKDIADTSWHADPSAASFTIGTAGELVGLARLVNDGNSFSNKTITLSDDIDLKDIEWAPIGTGNNPFRGNFKGNGKKILNLSINRDTNYNGLFGKSLDGKLENVTLENVSILVNTPDTPNYSYTGSLAGQAQHVNNITVTGSINIVVTGAGRYIGGIVGFLYDGSMSGGEVNNAVGVGLISGKYDVGGLAGYVYYGTSITDSTVKNVEINGYRGVGGVSGRIQNEVENAKFLLENINIENIQFTDFYEAVESSPVGGFLGYPYLGITVTINNSTVKDVTIESSHPDNGLFYGLYENNEDNGKVILENITVLDD